MTIVTQSAAQEASNAHDMTCGDVRRTKCFDGISNSVFCRTPLYRLFSTAAHKGLGGKATVGVCFYMFGV